MYHLGINMYPLGANKVLLKRHCPSDSFCTYFYESDLSGTYNGFWMVFFVSHNKPRHIHKPFLSSCSYTLRKKGKKKKLFMGRYPFKMY